MRIFITGIAGFIGFHLALALKKKGYEVTGCDSFNQYYEPELKELRAKIMQENGIEIHRFDILNLDDHEVHLEGITHLVHFAAIAGVRYSIEHPEEYMDINITGTYKLLEYLKRNPHIEYVYASSSSVYSGSDTFPSVETEPADKPLNLYAATKRSNELMCYTYHSLFGIKMRGLRFFTVYGTFGRPDMALFKFADLMKKGEPIEVYNNGDMLRDFTYVDDIVSGVTACIEKSMDFEIFNLASGYEEKLTDMISFLEEGINLKAEIKLVPGCQGEPTRSNADLTKAKEMLGYNPQVRLKEGISRFSEWFLEYRA